MPSNTFDDIIPNAVGCHSRAQDHAGTQTVFVDAVVAGIHTAVTAGAFTATVAIGATTSDNLQWVMEELRKSGFGVSISTTNLVITW